MINNLQISAVHANLNNDLKKYVNKKIGKLDKYLPKRVRESTFVDVKIKEKKKGSIIVHECKVIMQLPKKVITVHKDSITAKAAVDEVENNLKNQLKKYKDVRIDRKHRRLYGLKPASTI